MSDPMDLGHDPKLDKLAKRVSDVLDDENAFDVARVCAMITVVAVVGGVQDNIKRKKDFALIIEFMRNRFKAMTEYN